MESSASTSAKNSQFWIDKLALDQHPFMNGYYKEVFRDTFEVTGGCDDLEGARSASSLIYFLHLPQQKLDPATIFFKMQSSVVTHFYTGHPVTIYWLTATDKLIQKVILGEDNNWNFVVPANTWFTRILELDDHDSITIDDDNTSLYSLVGVSQAPGFDYNDLKTANYESLMTAEKHQLTKVDINFV